MGAWSRRAGASDLDRLIPLPSVLALLLVACISPAPIAGETFACSSTAACLSGSTCSGGVCIPRTRVSADADAPPVDAATVDVPPVDTSPSDAGPVAPDVIPDAGPAEPCDPVRQTGCPEGENCTYLGETDEPQCAPAGPAGYGESCSAEEPCAEGLCVSLTPGLPFLCFRFCASGLDCPLSGQCLDVGQEFGLCQIAGLYAECDLLTGAPCEGGQGCYFATGEDEPICLPAGTATLDDACDNANDCNVGLACVAGACRALCDPEAGEECPGIDGAECKGYFGDAGYCLVED